MPGSGHLGGTVFEEHRALFQSLRGLLQQHTNLWCLLLSQIPALPLHPPASIAWPIVGEPSASEPWKHLLGIHEKSARHYLDKEIRQHRD